jgi:hypothetical protein
MRFVPVEVEKFFTKLTQEALEYRKANHSDRIDFLEYLGQLKEKKNLTNLDTGLIINSSNFIGLVSNQVLLYFSAAHCITFFVDGFETSSIFISYVLYAVSRNR